MQACALWTVGELGDLLSKQVEDIQLNIGAGWQLEIDLRSRVERIRIVLAERNRFGIEPCFFIQTYCGALIDHQMEAC